MSSKRLMRTGLAALGGAVVVTMGIPSQAAVAPSDHGVAKAQGAETHSAKTHSENAQGAEASTGEAHGITAEQLEAMSGAGLLEPPPGGWPVPSDRSYQLQSSCQPYASVIAQGAAAWQGLDRSGGTPVECRNAYISDCGAGGRIVGCNWGQGQRIALYMGGVRDQRLLAAHEFGHDWYGHSSYQCAGWGSPSEVMAPTMCGPQNGLQKPVPID